jgi:hypothetical protein
VRLPRSAPNFGITVDGYVSAIGETLRTSTGLLAARATHARNSDVQCPDPDASAR